MKQTDLSGHTGTESQSNTETNDQRSGGAPSSRNTRDSGDQGSEVSKLRDSEIDGWIAKQQAHEENYGYFHLFVVAESNIAGVEKHLRFRREIDHQAPGDSQSRFNDRISWGESRSETIRGQLIEWKLDRVAMPFHPEIRDVPAAQLQIFVADPAREVLRRQGVEIDSVIKKLNQLDEHAPTEEQIERQREYTDAKEAIRGISGDLEQRVRKIENTIRARLEFSRRYGSGVPEPDPEYQDLGISKLEEQLRDARENVERTEQREEELRQEISEARSEWKNETRSELFSQSS